MNLINISLHIFILFFFLSLLFVLYISKVTKDNINSSLNKFIIQNGNDVLSNIDKLDKEYSKSGQGNINWQEVYNWSKKLEENSQTSTIKKHNKNIYILSFIISGTILIFILGLIFYKKVIKKKNIGLRNIIIENIVIFVFIGIIEFLFFKYISVKYIPTTPNFVGLTVISKVRDELADKFEAL